MTSDLASSVTFRLRSEAIDVITHGLGLSLNAINAIALSSPVTRMLRQVTCSPAVAGELLEWYRTAATNALGATLPQSIARARHCIEASVVIRAAIDSGQATRRDLP